MRSANPTLLTFSGIDGAGKSTQIAALDDHLRNLGFRIIHCEFWSQVASFRRFREMVSLKAFKGDEGVGSPERPILRRDKNVDQGHVRLARLFLYALDALNLWCKVKSLSKAECDFVIFDRYIYDELANLPLKYRLIKAYARCILAIAPEPDFAWLLDTDPCLARLRKPEYPLEFLHQNRDSYLTLTRVAEKILVVHTRSESATFSEILQSMNNPQPRAGVVEALTP